MITIIYWVCQYIGKLYIFNYVHYLLYSSTITFKVSITFTITSVHLVMEGTLLFKEVINDLYDILFNILVEI